MANQTGARYLAKQRKKNIDKDVVCTSHYQTEQESIEVKPGVRKRKRR